MQTVLLLIAALYNSEKEPSLGSSWGFLTRGLITATLYALGTCPNTVKTHSPHFVALHCQEVGGKNYEASMMHVDSFIKELLSSDAMRDFSRARVYLDKNYKSQEQFTVTKKFKKVVGKEICSDTLMTSTTLEKEKFPQHYFPDCKWSRKGFIRTRWALADCVFDLVNIHLFHDASNLVAWEKSPSVYSVTRQKALGYALDRISDQRYEKVPYFIFGDFNFRLDSKRVIESLCSTATMQTVRVDGTNEADKLIFRESDNDHKVVLQLEKKLFNYINQDVFRENNGTRLLEFDKELSVFKDRLHELGISFPPRAKCPQYHSEIRVNPLVTRSESEEKSITYDNMGPNVCMGDHKPVYLYFRLTFGAGKHANKHKCEWCQRLEKIS
ncbi:putative type I inositol 1 [Triplophysa rosa]|uniref:inositol-polyphosphate 5-phosphatase n=1 Tax=Triplophysa rosa TaxID=992332 RepID=A0A9W7WMY5_TRIRA|nr:putative type I inositol 1 [Triplophysa rosa]